MGLLKVEGTLTLAQFWPGGESDGDTAKVHVSATAFKFQSQGGAQVKTKHVSEGARVSGKVATKPAIDNKQRITIRLQGIDATELHYQASPVSKKQKAQMTNAQLQTLKQFNKRYRQF